MGASVAGVTERRTSRGAAIVTGAGGGIGRAVCERLDADGYSVVGVDLHDTAESNKAVTVRGDIRSLDTARRAIDASRELGGAVALVNAAGIRRYRHFIDLDQSVLEDHLSINTTAPALWMHAFARDLDARGASGGAVVNITSVMAHTAVAQNAAYCASKAALLGLSRAAARDLASRRIRVNCIAPGPTDTEMLHAGTALPPGLMGSIPLGRLGAPSEIAAAAAFLVSSDANFVTGATLFVDGGYLTV